MTIDELTPPTGEKRYTLLWLAWIAAFFAIELPPIFHKHSVDTLSDHVWWWFGIPKHHAPTKTKRLRRLFLLGFMAWLSAHFLSGDDI